ncbi:PAX3-and PAX7-binding protein 1 [Fasciola gigantica]|uniref:PAX3-and PAX7-binding protein 1 n=1 Tax=Fasciola gigantica TaxID=46835 RepID=A0A504Z0E4_FASGI|nr:PAX3-and PAX7-binding protein 1 [Fasciola gigantica]
MSDVFIKKVRRNYRSKARDSDEEIPNEQESLYEQGAKVTFVAPVSTGVKKSKSVLSFEDDLDPDDGDEFKVKKTNLSRRLTKQVKDHKKKKPNDNAAVIKVVNRKEPIERKPDPPEEEEQADSEEKLERLRKQLLDLAEDEESEPETVCDVKVNPLFKKGAIPDAATIHMARKQREKAKILLESADTNDTVHPPGRSGNKRLVNEDDDDDDEDDEGDDNSRYMQSTSGTRRPAFVVSEARDTIVKRQAIGARLRHRENELESIRQDFLATEHGSDRDSDQEAEWERQQIQKALINQNPAVMEALQPTTRTDSSTFLPGSSADLSSTEHLLPALNAASVTLDNVKACLLEKYEKMSKSLAEHSTALKQAQLDLKRGRQVQTECRKRLPELAQKFAYAQELKSYVDDLVECFNEKMSKLEYLEKRSIILLRERYQKLIERRRQDMKDMADFATQTSAPQNQTSKNPDELKQIEAKRRRCAERESRRMRRQRARENASGAQIMVPHHVDGTSTDDEEPQSVIAKRKADLDALLVDADALFEDVVDEYCHLPSILQRFADWYNHYPQSYAEAYAALCLPQLFSPIVRMQMIGWNPFASQTDSTNLHQMDWFRDLLDFACFPPDLTHVKSEPAVKDESENDENSITDSSHSDKHPEDVLRLLPYTVEKVVLLRLNELILASWDPLSGRESQQLFHLVQDLTTTYPTLCVGSRLTEQLFETIVRRMEVTIQEDIFIPLYPKHLMQNRQSPAYNFFDRQFHVGMKLLKNILMWHNVISNEALQHVSLTCLINRYLLVGLASLLSVVTPTGTGSQSAAEEIKVTSSATGANVVALTYQYVCDRLCEIVDLIPRDWFSSSGRVKAEPSNGTCDEESKSISPIPDPLTQLRRFLAQLLDRCVNGSGQLAGATTEREWIAALSRLKSLVD